MSACGYLPIGVKPVKYFIKAFGYTSIFGLCVSLALFAYMAWPFLACMAVAMLLYYVVVFLAQLCIASVSYTFFNQWFDVTGWPDSWIPEHKNYICGCHMCRDERYGCE